MGVWPPQNTGIFAYKIMGGGPRDKDPTDTNPGPGSFWLRPDIPYYADNSSPVKTSTTTPIITFTPVGNQGSVLTLLSVSPPLGTSGAYTVTQTGPFSFQLKYTYTPFGSNNALHLFVHLVVSYSDEDGNVGWGRCNIGALFLNTTGSSAHIGGLSQFTAAGATGVVATSGSQTIATPALILAHGGEFDILPSSQTLATSEGLELSPDDWDIGAYGGFSHTLSPPASCTFYCDSQYLGGPNPQFDQIRYGLCQAGGDGTYLGTPYWYYTDIVPVIFTITGNPYSK